MKTIGILVTGIRWDTKELEGLPTEVRLEVPSSEYAGDYLREYISDKISDDSGWCHKGWDDCEVELTEDNIPLCFEHLSRSDKKKNIDLIHFSFSVRYPSYLEDKLNIPRKKLEEFWKFKTYENGRMKSQSYFGIEDTLKPVDEYIEKIKSSTKYLEVME